MHTNNLNLQKDKTELKMEITELKAKNDLFEHEAQQTRLKLQEEVKRVDTQRREMNSMYQEVKYRLEKQIELHGDFNLINKENKALNNINMSLEKQITMLTKEIVEMRVKYEKAQDETKKLSDGNNDLMILISEANAIKREQQSIIGEYKLQNSMRSKKSRPTVALSDVLDTDDLCEICFIKV